jgi:hypothetical protein
MTNWFQTDEAYDLFAQCGDFEVVRVSSECWVCQVVVSGAWWCRRGIVQGGVAQKNDVVDLPESHQKTDLSNLLGEVRAVCMNKHCVYVEIRNFDDYAAFKETFSRAGFTYNPHYDVHLHIASQDEMVARMHESKQRALKRALAEGQTWREAATEDDIRAFYALLKSLYRKKVKRPLPSQDFFLQAWRQGVTVLVTEQNRSITGGVLMPVMREKNVAYEWYICGGVMSTWAMMEWGSMHGISMIDMMGAGEPDVSYGVRDFKLQMGGTLHEFGRFLWINNNLKYRLGKLVISHL